MREDQKHLPWWKRRTTAGGKPSGTLILLRHGETEVPRGTSFIGWSDPDLNRMGEEETIKASRAIREAGYTFDVAYTSVLKRAVRTTWLLLQQLDKIHLPVWKHWRLNERCYGALTAEPVDDLQRKYGDGEVASWRRSWEHRPPAFPPGHPQNPTTDVRYDRWQDRKGKIRPVQLPDGETMGECIDRVKPVWKREILADLRRGKSVLVVGHGNTIRAIVQSIDDLSDEETMELEIPPCIPLVYRFQRKGAIEALAEGAGDASIALASIARLKEVAQALRQRIRGTDYKERRDSLDLIPIIGETAVEPLSGEYLGKPGNVRAAQDRVRQASLARYGIGDNFQKHQQKRNDGTFGAFLTPSSGGLDAVTSYEPALAATMPQTPSMAAAALAAQKAALETAASVAVAPPSPAPPPPSAPVEAPAQAEASILLPGGGAMVPNPRSGGGRRPQHVVIIRHGKTEHNKLGLFTGWEDVSLATEGRAEATNAGRMLARHGISFDVVYTSWLSRAIETAWLVLVELDAMWLPIHKSWRLNERMYGALTGLSKKKTRTVYGDVQFKKWRRSYNTRPPAVSSFSGNYPGNDQRYVDNIIDVRFSAKESLIRSLESGRVRVHRKLPRTESLKDCMDRTIPYWVNSIEGEAIKQGKSVLIASSENAIRGLLMHLLKIPKSEIVNIEVRFALRCFFTPFLASPLASHLPFFCMHADPDRPAARLRHAAPMPKAARGRLYAVQLWEGGGAAVHAVRDCGR